MKKSIIAAMLAMIAAACTKEEDFVCENMDQLIDIVLEAGAGIEDTDVKTWTGWQGSSNLMYWSKGDKIGIFAGNGNINRDFTLCGDGNSASGQFAGQMSPVSSATMLWAYYPYTPDATKDKICCPNMSNQIFKGTFDEKGRFENYGDYAFLLAWLNNFTMTSGWPSGKSLSFNTMTSIVRFKIQNSLSKSLDIKSVCLEADRTAFTYPYYYSLSNTGYSWTWYITNTIGTTISDDNPLTVGKDETKYVQMAAYQNSFDSEEILVKVTGSTEDHRNVKYSVTKAVSSSNSFAPNKRTTISVPLTSDTPATYSSKVSIVTTSDAAAVTAPEFTQGSGYEAGDTWWGDDSRETFHSGASHSYSSAGTYEASFNHFGASSSIRFDSLEGIASIDFSLAF